MLRIRRSLGAAIGISITPLRYLSVLLLALTAVSIASAASSNESLNILATPSLTPAAVTVTPGGTITFTLANGPANRFDWVGLFCPASTSDSGYIDWKYLSNSRTAPAVGLAAATITMTAPSAAGTTCDARLFANDTLTKLATSATVTVTVTPTLTMGPVAVAPGGTLTIALTGGPANRFDWVGLFCPASNGDSGYIDWKYLSNSRIAPAVGLAAATMTMTAPSAAGTTCNARLFGNDTSTTLATSVTVTVTATATLTMAPVAVAPSGTLTIAVAGGPANRFDWVGLFCPASNGDTAYVDWKYLSNSRNPPAVGLAAATLTMAAPAAAGTTCNARFFADHTYTKFATSATSTVTDPTDATLVAAYSYNDGAGTTAADTSVNNNTAAIFGTTWSTACKFGRCLSFNGASFVESPDIQALTPANEATFEAWVTLAAAPAETASIFNKWNQTADDEYLVGISPGRALVFYWQTSGGGSWPSPSFNGAGSMGTIPLNTLTHIAVVRSGATLTFYINGTPEPSLTVLDTNPFRNGVNTLRIGGQGRGGWENRFFTGVIDEARIYSRALTQAEIQADMNTPIDPDTTPPVLSAISASAVTASSATIRWTTNESSDTEIEYGLTTAYGSATPLNGTLVTDHWVTVGALPPGTLHHYRVRSRDGAGNLAVSGDHTFTTAIDVTPPTVSLTAPAANSTVSGIVTVSANAADNVGVVGVQFKLDGADLGVMDTAAPYAISWDTTAASIGAHTLTAVVWDAAGNSTSSTAVTVTVSRSSAGVTLAWDANTEASLAGYRVHVGDASGVYTMSFDVGNTTTYTVTGLQAGRLYYFAVTAYDQSMNESGFSNEVSTMP